jgi:RHS repeat-associated protein
VYLLTNTSGNRVSEYRYRAWGDRYVTGTGESVQSPFTYKGREEDRETGLVYMRHRYYSPRLERFISQDPSGINGGLNVYAFAEVDPCNGADPMGLGGCGNLFLGALMSFGADALGLKAGLAVVKGTLQAAGGRTLLTEAGSTAAGAVAGGMVAEGAADVASGVAGTAVRNGVAEGASGDYDNGLTGTAEDVVDFLKGVPVLGTGIRFGEALDCAGAKLEQLARESVWEGIDR